MTSHDGTGHDGTGHDGTGWRAWLLHPLAADEHRTEFWVRHVRMGVVLSELTAAAAGVYLLGTPGPHRHALAALFTAVVLGTPGVLALPVRRIARHQHGSLLPTLWSLALIATVTTAAALDGGARSPLTVLLFLALAFAGLAYRPGGVIVLGSLMTGAEMTLLALDSAALTPDKLVLPGALLMTTVMTAWAAGNVWDNYDRQLALADQLATLVAVDDLTGSLSRRGLYERLDSALAAPGVHALLMVDLDGFKQVNDALGHEEGDVVLVRCARAICASARHDDAVGRVGGDEFAVLLPQTPLPAAARIADDVRRAIAAAGARWGVTASIGVAAHPGPALAHALLTAADQAMYTAKRAGRDQVSTAGPIPQTAARTRPHSGAHAAVTG